MEIKNEQNEKPVAKLRKMYAWDCVNCGHLNYVHSKTTVIPKEEGESIAREDLGMDNEDVIENVELSVESIPLEVQCTVCGDLFDVSLDEV